MRDDAPGVLEATTQIVAAEVRPVTIPPPCMIVPAPMKPMPDTICAARRAGSPTRCPFSTMPIFTETSVSSVAPTQIRMFVRKPAGFPLISRSRPIAPPRMTARPSLRRRSRRSALISSVNGTSAARSRPGRKMIELPPGEISRARVAASASLSVYRMSRSRTSPGAVSGDESPYEILRACSSSCAIEASSGSVGVAKLRKTVPPHRSHFTASGTA